MPTTASALGPNNNNYLKKKKKKHTHTHTHTFINIIFTVEKEKIHKVRIAVLFIR